jgi:hypothetical protein
MQAHQLVRSVNGRACEARHARTAAARVHQQAAANLQGRAVGGEQFASPGVAFARLVARST